MFRTCSTTQKNSLQNSICLIGEQQLQHPDSQQRHVITTSNNLVLNRDDFYSREAPRIIKLLEAEITLLNNKLQLYESRIDHLNEMLDQQNHRILDLEKHNNSKQPEHRAGSCSSTRKKVREDRIEDPVIKRDKGQQHNYDEQLRYSSSPQLNIWKYFSDERPGSLDNQEDLLLEQTNKVDLRNSRKVNVDRAPKELSVISELESRVSILTRQVSICLDKIDSLEELTIADRLNYVENAIETQARIMRMFQLKFLETQKSQKEHKEEISKLMAPTFKVVSKKRN